MKRDLDLSRFFCVNPACSLHNQKSKSNIIYRSMTGKDRHIMRLRCKACGKEFSERKYTLQERSHIAEDKIVQMMRCVRWGVPREGISDICGVNIKTVDAYLDKGSLQAQKWHEEKVVGLEEEVQADEAYGKISGKAARWIAAAITMHSLLIVALSFGGRDQNLCDTLIARVLAACRRVPMFLTDGWAPYASSLCRMLGHLFVPRGKRVSRMRCRGVMLAQVVKRRDARGRLLDVTMRAVMGGAHKCCNYFKGKGLGNVIHTIHIERWFGSLRSYARCFQRRSRFLPKLHKRQEASCWLYVHFYNWLIPHTTLSKRYKKLCTPAMVAGLCSCPLNYYQWISTPIAPQIEKREEKWLKAAQDPIRLKAYSRSPMDRGKVIYKTDMEAIAC